MRHEMSAIGVSIGLVTRLPLAACATWLSLASDGACQSPSPAAASPSLSVRRDALSARFDSREIKTSAEPGADVVELCYEFTNTGEIPLVVQEFSQSCGCMKGMWSGVPVEPGARGKIIAKLLTKGLRGTVRKSLRVGFVEGGTVELIGEVKIPEALEYSERTLRWTEGDSARPQQVDVSVNSKEPVLVLSVSANDSSFSCELQTVEEGRRYKITVIPRETATVRVCVMQVRTDSKDPRDALQGLFALVEKPKSEGARP